MRLEVHLPQTWQSFVTTIFNKFEIWWIVLSMCHNQRINLSMITLLKIVVTKDCQVWGRCTSSLMHDRYKQMSSDLSRLTSETVQRSSDLSRLKFDDTCSPSTRASYCYFRLVIMFLVPDKPYVGIITSVVNLNLGGAVAKCCDGRQNWVNSRQSRVNGRQIWVTSDSKLNCDGYTRSP